MPSSVSSPRPAERRRLEAWKGIAQYLDRDVTTVRRWEKREGLPVHRHLHAKLGSVYAFTDEIDEWWRTRSVLLDREPDPLRVDAGDGPRVIPEPLPVTSARVPMIPSALATATALAVLLIGIAISTTPGLAPALGKGNILRLAIPRPPNVVQESLAISPDGKRVAFAGRSADRADLWIQELASPDADRLPGTAGAAFPFWSPDGQHVGFFAEGRLKIVALATRDIRDLAAAPEGLGGTWNERGEIVFAPSRGHGLMLTSVHSGGALTVTKVTPAHKTGHAWPEFLPDGRHVLYTDYVADMDQYGIYVLNLDTGVRKQLIRAFSRASYSPGLGKEREGFLLYARDSLIAQPFDLTRLEVRGTPRRLADRVLQWGDLAHHADFSVSREGTLVARTANEERHRLVWIDRKSRKVTGEIGEPGYSSNPTLSPDGKALAVTMHEDQPYRDRIWLFDTATGVRRPFTEGPAVDFAPIWLADRMLFSTLRDRRNRLYQRPLIAGIEAAVDAPSDVNALESSNRDGSVVTFMKLSAATKSDVWAWRPGDPASAVPVLTGPENEGHSRLSPDGRYLAYASNESGRFEVYVRTFPEARQTWQVSLDGGADPKWSSNGRELFFIAGDRQMMEAAVSTTPALRTSTPTALFDTHLEMVWMDTRNHYDITPDGRRFVLLTPESDRRTAPFTVIGNWR